MVTKEQLLKGILEYSDKEIIPYLPTAGKWGVGSMVLIAQNRAEYILSSLSKNSVFNSLGIVDCDGKIDIDMVCDAMCESACRYGKLEISIPLLGNMTFSEDDVTKLHSYIIGGN